MVDKENQWDDIEYSGDEAEYEEAEDQEEYSEEEYETAEYEDGEEYEDEEYEDGEEYDEEYEDEDEEGDGSKKSNAIPLIAILLIILLLAGAGYFAYTKFVNGASSIAKTPGKTSNEAIHVENTQNNPEQNNQMHAPAQNNTQDMGDFFFNEAGGNDADMMSVDFNDNGQTNVTQAPENDILPVANNNDVVATVTEQPETSANELAPEDILGENGFNESEENTDNAIMVTYNKETRMNPFKPPVTEKGEELDGVNESGFEIIEPPSTSIQDENLKKLLQTQISGILYDEVSPSAIVNLNGVDQFVKIGDKVSGYVIEDIRKDKVQISYKNNSYVASVGELFTRGLLEKQPAVANFENKFAGRHRENN